MTLELEVQLGLGYGDSGHGNIKRKGSSPVCAETSICRYIWNLIKEVLEGSQIRASVKD